jgi:hypothetical protein
MLLGALHEKAPFSIECSYFDGIKSFAELINGTNFYKDTFFDLYVELI